MLLLSFIKTIRTKIWTFIALYHVKQYGQGVHVNKKTKFTSNTIIGNNCHFNGMKVTGMGRVIIGNNFHSGGGILIITSYHNYDNGKCIPYDDTYISKDVVIKDNVWLGENVTILAGVTIGEGAVIQAGSVVVNNIPSLSIAGGHPACVFKKRDEKHYYDLKAQNLYM